MSKNAFKLLKPEIGKAIYDLKWKNFRVIQDQSIHDIVETKNDVIISAPTASGKTEAAFLPSISESTPDINNTIKIIYISPLKALINDQFLRIDNLCKYIDCKVTKWHGDASQTLKKKLLANPSGILLITPESLESLLITRSQIIFNLFKDVDFYIVDEVHSFVGDSRGEQLKSILNRIDSIIKHRTRRILLSATIGSLDNYKQWLKNKSPIFIENKDEGKGIRGSIRFFESDSKTIYYKELEKIISKGKKLIFGNSKSSLESICSTLKSIDKNNSQIEIHHGSLSKEQKEFIENRLRKESHLSVFCTNTLELGIDIGDIDEIGLIAPPWSVASFIQKIGRSGRKENSKIEFSFILYNIPMNSKSHICDGLRIDLIQSIAIVELMLDNWCEPKCSQTGSYSTFIHQVMAYIAQTRVTTSEQIWNEIVTKSFPEKYLKLKDYTAIIEYLIKTDYINRDSTGELFLGREGDRLTESYDFYSVFFTPEEWVIYKDNRILGTIPIQNLFKEGDTILFSGKKWKVKNIDFNDKVLQVIPAQSGNPPIFTGNVSTIHYKLHKKMQSIYESNDDYKYLMEDSRMFLSKARRTYRILVNSNDFIPIFMGSGVCKTASFILRALGYSFEELGIALYFNDLERDQAMNILKEYNWTTPNKVYSIFFL